MLDLQPITLLPARERVASALRKAILSRQLEEGTVLTLDATAKSLGVSVTPVREAFQILARDDLIEMKQNRTAVVLGVNARTITEHYQVRAALESAACILVCENGADLSPIVRCYEEADQALREDNGGSFANYNQSFHYEIWKAAGNDKMKNMLSELWNGLSMGLRSTVAEYANRSQAEHEQIVQALQDRDAESAGRLMHHHIIRSMEDILTRYEE